MMVQLLSYYQPCELSHQLEGLEAIVECIQLSQAAEKLGFGSPQLPGHHHHQVFYDDFDFLVIIIKYFMMKVQIDWSPFPGRACRDRILHHRRAIFHPFEETL